MNKKWVGVLIHKDIWVELGPVKGTIEQARQVIEGFVKQIEPGLPEGCKYIGILGIDVKDRRAIKRAMKELENGAVSKECAS